MSNATGLAATGEKNPPDRGRRLRFHGPHKKVIGATERKLLRVIQVSHLVTLLAAAHEMTIIYQNYSVSVYLIMNRFTPIKVPIAD